MSIVIKSVAANFEPHMQPVPATKTSAAAKKASKAFMKAHAALIHEKLDEIFTQGQAAKFTIEFYANGAFIRYIDPNANEPLLVKIDKVQQNAASQMLEGIHAGAQTRDMAHLVYPETYHTALNATQLRDYATTEYHTHTTLHTIGEALLTPANWGLQLLARAIQPLPGENKDKYHPILIGLYRFFCALAAVAVLLISIPFGLMGIALRAYEHSSRPAISYIKKEFDPHSIDEPLYLSEEIPFHVASLNVGLVPTPMGIVGDLRHPETRAQEIVNSLLEDAHAPDVICFQETFNEEAAKILCNGLKQKYHIIHSIAPSLSGFSSGSMIASKYPITDVEFHKLEGMLGPEKLAPRGVTKIRLESEKGPVFVYNVHTQAIIGEHRAEIRYQQLEQIRKIMEADKEKCPEAHQILAGDFNTSAVTAWGEDNMMGEEDAPHTEQAEKQVMKRFNEYFDDFYLADHDGMSGMRNDGEAFFLAHDNSRMGVVLEEPSGSWHSDGPFSNPGETLAYKMQRDRKQHHRPDTVRAAHLQNVTNPTHWGTGKWHSSQTLNTARFDYIGQPKGGSLEGKVEIRRLITPKGSPSAMTDHTLVSARLFVPVPTHVIFVQPSTY